MAVAASQGSGLGEAVNPTEPDLTWFWEDGDVQQAERHAAERAGDGESAEVGIMCFRWSVKSKILEQRRRTGTGGRGDNLSLSLSVLPGLRRIYQLQFSSGNVRNVAGR